MSDVNFESFGTITKPVADYWRWGQAVSLSADGTRMAVSAFLGGPNRNGVVVVYQYSESSGWTQLGNDIIGSSNEWSGRSVRLSGNGEVVVLSAEYNHEGGRYAGQTRAYRYDSSGESWIQYGAGINGEYAYDAGYSVSVSYDGTRLVHGAANNDGTGQDAGHVRVYDYDEALQEWVQLGSDIDGESPGDYSGYAVDMSADGTIIIIGAVGNAGGGVGAGHVRVYALADGQWVQRGEDIDGESQWDQLGRSVAISGDGSRIIVAANNNDGGGLNSGAAKVYEWIGTAWVQVGQDIHGQQAGDKLGLAFGGSAVAIDHSGNYIVVGAVEADQGGTELGEARVFYWSTEGSGEWVQVGDTYVGTVDRGRFGESVAIASEALVIAMGEAGHANDATQDGNAHTFGVKKVIENDFWGSVPML